MSTIHASLFKETLFVPGLKQIAVGKPNGMHTGNAPEICNTDYQDATKFAVIKMFRR